MIKYYTWTLRFLLILPLVILLPSCGRKNDVSQGKLQPPPAVPVQTGFVTQMDVPVEIRAIGNVEPIASIAVKAQVGGELIGVSFEEGQNVKKGDLLFTIQPRLYATQLAQAQANLARDRAQAANARRELARQEELDRKGAGIKEELDRSRAQAEAAEATTKADEALVLIAETQLGYTTIESPIDGRAGAIRSRPGNLIKAGDDLPLTTVVQLAPIYAAFAVPEQQLSEIRNAMELRRITVAARESRDGTLLGEGELTFIANMVDSTTGTIGLKATFPNTKQMLWPGAFVDILLRINTERDATVVPSSAITIGQNGASLYVVGADATAHIRMIKTGRTTRAHTVVTEGVKLGEKIVINGQSRLIPGAKVVEKQAAQELPEQGENPAEATQP